MYGHDAIYKVLPHFVIGAVNIKHHVDVPSLHHIKTFKMPHFIPPQRVL